MALYREFPRERLIDGLNERQLEAVEHLDGPLLVLAGAGTGKTTVIAKRIVNLLRSGAQPEQILALTFTKKAALEMYERVSMLLGAKPRGMVISTFHALGFRLIQREGHHLGLKNTPKLIEREAQRELARRVLEEVNPEGDITEAGLLTAISRAKNRGLSPESFKGRVLEGSSQRALRAFEHYEATLRTMGLIDFDDMIALAVRLLRDVELVRLECQRRWPYVLVDEYQDTSRDQYAFVKLLLGPQQNLCVVGDDDQSIYRFRGAEVGNILAFKKQFPSAKVVLLETNYRSTAEVIDVANAVISQARKRYAKRLVAAAGQTGVPVRLVHAFDELDEERFVVREIKRLVAAGVPYGDIAILHRVRKGLRPFAERFRNLRIPHQEGAENAVGERGVTLMTLHAAKGLEFPHVFMPSVEDGTIPHFNAVKDGTEAIDEERRLLYVGVTRAKKRLVLSASSERRGYRQRPSRFLGAVTTPALVDVRA